MARLLSELYISLQVVTFVLFCCRESSSLNLQSNHRFHPTGIARSFNRIPSTSTSSILGFRLQAATSLDAGDDTSTTAASWDDILAPASAAPTKEHKEITALDKAGIVLFTGLAVSAFLTLILKSAPGSWRFFLAGGLCAATSHTIPTPVDVVKTRKQIDPKLLDMSFLDAGRHIVKEEGFSTLWAGLGPTTFGYLLEGSVKFGIYEVLKPALRSWLSRIASLSSSLAFFNSQFLAFFLSGIVSGLAASLVLCPMEVIRIRMVAEPNYTSGGWIGGGFKILRTEGVHGFSKGVNPMILKQVPYTVTKNVSFDMITKFFYSTLKNSGVASVSTTMKFMIPLVSAAIASVLSSLTSQPGDTILSLSCAHDGDYKTRDISRNILRSDRGIAGFFVGTKTRLLHVGIIVTIQLLIYDYVKRLCGIGATGL